MGDQFLSEINMDYSQIFLVITLSCMISDTSCLTVNQLHSRYYDIFHRSQNRNAASHLWASYILDRASGMTSDKIRTLFGGFCPVSGSPVSPTSRNVWSAVPIKTAADTNQIERGNVHVCCWPCVCDLQEFVKVDQLDVDTQNGLVTFDALVIGDPCIHPNRIPTRAPELQCENGRLAGAYRSRGGHIVIGMLQEPQTSHYQARMISDQCARRKRQGYRSGMGKIFVEVASINPIR